MPSRTDASPFPSLTPHVSLAERELRAVREIAHALLVAAHPRDVQQIALERVSPILGAAFALVMQLTDEDSTLRPVAQHDWPVAHRGWIGALRVRVGDGPSGIAVAERRVVEVEDVFADPALASWHTVAHELGFRSIIAAPLEGAHGPLGAIAFYFELPTSLGEEQRALVRLVADQLAASAEKAALLDALRRSNAALADANEALEREVQRADAARHESHALLSGMIETLSRSAVTAERLQVASRITSVVSGWAQPVLRDVDPRTPLRSAVSRAHTRMPALALVTREPTMLLPQFVSDDEWVSELLGGLLDAAGARARTGTSVEATVEQQRGAVVYTVSWDGEPLAPLDVPLPTLLGPGRTTLSLIHI